MHGFLLNIFLNHSIAIAALAGAVRFKTVFKNFQPFLLFIWLGLINETLSLILIYSKGSNTVNSNIYVLLECILILYQFYTWASITQTLCFYLATAAVLVWIADNLMLHRISGNNSAFRIFYSFIIVCCSINQVNKLLINERFNLIKNPVFLICIAFLLFYACKAFVEVFNAFNLRLSNACNRSIFTILYLADFISNMIYAIAIICIPKKPLFTMPY